MTKDKIISMAQEVRLGNALSHNGSELRVFIEGSDWHDELMRFAALVAAAEREECIKLCKDELAESDYAEASVVYKCIELINARWEE